MKSLHEEALDELVKEAYNDTITISDQIIIEEYHNVLIKLIEKRIDEHWLNGKTNLQEIKEILK